MMSNQNDKFSTILYVNDEHCSDHRFNGFQDQFQDDQFNGMQQFDRQINGQFKSELNDQLNSQLQSQLHNKFNNNSNDQQVSNQQVNDLYQNIREIERDELLSTTSITPSEGNSISPINQQVLPRIPPPIKPRLSLLSKKLKDKQQISKSCEALEQIDENLNLILKRHNENMDKIEALASELRSVSAASKNSKSSKVPRKNSSQESEVIYLNTGSLETGVKVEEATDKSTEESSSESNYESSYENNDQFGQTDQLLSRISALNRNTYISHADVSGEVVRKFDLNDRFSSNYNELEEPIYSDIIFDDKSNATSIYDVPASSETTKFLKPPPLPPRPQPSPTNTIDSAKDCEINDLKIDVPRNDQNSDPRNNLKSELTNELKNFHLKNTLNLPHHQSSSLNNLLNNVPTPPSSLPIHQASISNPFSIVHNNSDLKLNEIKESLNVMRKDHFLSLSDSLKRDPLKNSASRLNKDELSMFERPTDDAFATFSKLNKFAVNINNDQGYGKINKIEIQKDVSDDEGSLKSSFSYMDSQINSSSNDTFSYKSVKSNRSNNSNRSFNKIVNKQLKNIGVIAPFSIRASASSNTSSSGDHLDKTPISNQLEKQQKALLTVQLNDELKSTLSNKEVSPLFNRKHLQNSFNQEDNELDKSKDDEQSDRQKIMHQQMINQQLLNQQLMSQQNQFNHEIENNANTNNNFSADTMNHLNNVKEYLYKTGSNRKQFNRRWCVLSESALFYYNEEKQNLNDLKCQAKGHIELNDILFINSVVDNVCLVPNRFRKAIKSIKSKVNNIELYQFNIGINSENGRLHLLACENSNRRQCWIDLLAFKIRPKLKPTQHIKWKNIDACGYLNIKIGLTGLWTKCFTILQQRTLNIQLLDMVVNCSEEDGKKVDLITIDLRQVMSIGWNQNAQIKSCEQVYETGPVFYLNRRYETVLYFQADYKSHSEEWFHSIENNWILPENGVFEDQLLAPNCVPIAIEKCLNFISTYNGISTKQIYKASGDDTYTKTIVENLKSSTLFDWHILPEDGFTVLDVSDALKIYLKSFPECLLTEKLYQDFLKLNFCTNYTERLIKLKLLLKRLPLVNYNTLKKLICHFILFIENSAENEMTLDSLAYAICPYLIFSKISANPELNLSVSLFKDLVNSYIWLFDLKEEELQKERKIEQSLKELRKLKVQHQEDKLLVTIYLFNKTWGRTLTVPINSTMTADDLLFYVTKIGNLKESPEKLCVCEVVANDLERVIHYSERIKQITLGWTVKWPQQDAKSNYLLIKLNSLYEELDDYFDKGLNSLPVTMFNEVRFSEEGNNKFRKVFLELSNSKFSIFKDAKATKALKTWNLEDVTWYLGFSSKKFGFAAAKPPTRYCITLLDRHKPVQRQKDTIKSKIISFNTGEELAKWLSAIICSEHPEGIYPLIHLNDS